MIIEPILAGPTRLMVFALSLPLIIWSCGNDRGGHANNDLSSNQPPEIVSLMADPDTLGIGGSTSIVVNAVDPESDLLFYGWRASGGSITGNGPTATWTAPDGIGLYLISAFVEDDRLAAVNSTIEITVIGAYSDNRPPIISFISSNPDILPSLGVTEITVGASDPDGEDDLLDYQWGAAAGSFSGEGSVVTWTAPIPSCCPTAYSVWVLVRDPDRATSSGSTTITVIP
jgi:hypothetical protein